MQAGLLRKRITFQERTTAQDTFGAQTDYWSDMIPLFGEIVPATGRELQSAGAVQQTLSHVITVRWPGPGVSITPANRAIYNGRVFNIEYVTNVDERNKTLTIGAIELLNQG